MKLLQKFLPEFLCLGISFLLFSCSTYKDQNAVFEKKYGKSYEKVKAERTPAKGSQSVVTVLQAPTEADLRNMANESNLNDYAYVDVSKFGERVPQATLPNGEFYEHGRSQNPSNAVPPDLFEIGFNTELHPPFRKTGIEFDNISVPPVDVYGVKTEMSEKPYLLAGNNSLQENIIKINSEKTADDIEISEILIKEQKQLKRKQKMQEIFGTDSLEIEAVEPDEESFAKNKMVKVKDGKNPVPAMVKTPVEGKTEVKQGSAVRAIKKLFKN